MFEVDNETFYMKKELKDKCKVCKEKMHAWIHKNNLLNVLNSTGIGSFPKYDIKLIGIIVSIKNGIYICNECQKKGIHSKNYKEVEAI